MTNQQQIEKEEEMRAEARMRAEEKIRKQSKTSDKSKVVLMLLSFFLGGFGIDRFYGGRVGIGLLKLFTFGGVGVWSLVDFILAILGAQKDNEGLYIKK